VPRRRWSNQRALMSEIRTELKKLPTPEERQAIVEKILGLVPGYLAACAAANAARKAAEEADRRRRDEANAKRRDEEMKALVNAMRATGGSHGQN